MTVLLLCGGEAYCIELVEHVIFLGKITVIIHGVLQHPRVIHAHCTCVRWKQTFFGSTC